MCVFLIFVTFPIPHFPRATATLPQLTNMESPCATSPPPGNCMAVRTGHHVPPAWKLHGSENLSQPVLTVMQFPGGGDVAQGDSIHAQNAPPHRAEMRDELAKLGSFQTGFEETRVSGFRPQRTSFCFVPYNTVPEHICPYVPFHRKAFPSNMQRPCRMRGLQLVDSWSSRPGEPFAGLPKCFEGAGQKEVSCAGLRGPARAARAALGGVIAARLAAITPPSVTARP
jgi:hypothetical protein